MDNVFIWIVLFLIFIFVVRSFNSKNESSQFRDSNKSVKPDRKPFSVEKEISAELDRQIQEKSKPKPDIISVVGGFYRSWEAKRCIRKLYACETVFLKEEPDNPYDSNAIMILSKKGLHIGYVARYDISKVKEKMSEGMIKGSVYEIPDDRYEYQITLMPMSDDEDYNSALFFYNERKRIAEDSDKKDKQRDKLDFYNVLSLSRDFVSQKKYASIYKMLKPIFDADVQDKECYELMINSCHYLNDYEAELKYIDKYIESGEVRDRDFINRRKYHVLRLLGHLVSNDQIENEKAGVETTILELDFFNRIVSILQDEVDPNRIDFRDAKSLFAINLDGNTRRPICKLYLNNADKMFIGLINDDGSVLKVPINDISELDNIKEDLLRPIKKFL